MTRTAALALGLLFLSPKLASAADCTFDVSARTVVVGQPIVVQLTCDLKEGEPEPSEPKLTVNGPAEQSVPSRGSSSRVMMHNFSFSKTVSTIFSWTVTPTRSGDVTIGPASIKTGSGRSQSDAISVRVLEPGTQPRVAPRRSPFDFDPFDFMKGSQPPSQRPFATDRAPEALNLEAAPNEVVFLTARPSSRKVVLGEAVHLRVYAYGSQGPFLPIALEEPATADFLSFPVENDGQFHLQVVSVGNEDWLTGKLYDVWLVPLKTGTLKIGKVVSIVQGQGLARYPRKKISTHPITIEVSEPPKEGRPARYQPGDSGEFQLSASLTPRTLTSGDYVEAIITVEGKGNPPAKVLFPQQSAIEWQEPTSSSKLNVDESALNGQRIIKCLGRVVGAGTLSLGTVQLPYFNTRTKAYENLEADLGSISVTGTPAPPQVPKPVTKSAGETKPPVWNGELTPRRQYVTESAGPALESAVFWWPLVALPLFVGGWGGLRRLGRRRSSDRPMKTPKGGAYRTQLKEAEVLSKSGSTTEALRTLERALLSLLEEKFGPGLGGLQKAHLSPELKRRGAEDQLADESAELLVALETARYEGRNADGETLLLSVKAVVTRLEKLKPKKGNTR